MNTQRAVPFWLFPASIVVLCAIYFFLPPEWRFESPRFDSVFDTIGAATVFTLAIVILVNEPMMHNSNKRSGSMLPVALLAQALLHFLDSTTENVDKSVWLHRLSFMALAVGLQCSSEFYENLRPRIRNFLRWPMIAAFAGIVILGIAVRTVPDFLPSPFFGAGFSSPVLVACFLSVFFLMVAAVNGFRHPGVYNPYFLASTCLICGLGTAIFSTSEIWTSRWWYSLGVETLGLILPMIIMLRSYSRQLTGTVRTLETTKADLERSNLDLERFAAIAAHDLRSPIVTIQSWTDILRERLQAVGLRNVDEILAIIDHSAIRATKLIDDLLQLARVNGQMGECETLDLNQILREAVLWRQNEIRDHDVRLQIDPLPRVFGNRSLLLAVFDNLLRNAINYRDKDRQLKISIGCEENRSTYEFYVRDNGVGIAPQNLHMIFEMFSRLHSHSERPGTGIGLPFCKRVIEAHGGRIWAESTPGRGAVFFFILPKVREEVIGEPHDPPSATSNC